jgi:VCBS repeat-containing protein
MTDQNVSQTAGDAAATTTVARADMDSLPAGSGGPANGNVITGQGTDSGLNGADSVAHAPAHIVAIQGAGTAEPVTSGGTEVTGHFGVLTINADGTFHYVPNAGAPAGVQDVFGYTVADAAGQQSSSTLTIDLGVPGAAASQAAAQPTNLPPGVVNLPAGVQLSDVHVVGSDLVVHLPDGSQMVIPEGTIFVPQFVIGNVEVPAQNIAALLVDSEPKPAAGPPESAGGNFAGDVPPLDPGVPLGNLLPPTEFGYTPPQFEQPAGGLHNPPTVVIETPDNPLGAVDASESVFEKGLPARGSLPAGSGEIADGNPNNNSDPSESNTGTIVFSAQGGLQGVTIDGVAVSSVGQQINGQYGVLTITGIDLASGQITYSYTLSSNTAGDSTQDVFTVVVTDHSGEAATASLTVHVVDDVPTAHDDSASQAGINAAVSVNVIANDVQGADGVNLATGVQVVNGSLTGTGTLHYNGDGTFTYTPTAGESGDVTFQYTITDGDGDTSTATVTIHLMANSIPTISTSGGDSVDEAALSVGSNPSSPNETTAGSININSPDGIGKLVVNGVNVTNGGTVVGADGTLTVTHNADGTYSYSYTLSGPTTNDAAGDNFSLTVTDGNGDTASTTLHINIADDVPTANNDSATQGVENAPVTVNVIANDVQGADGVNLATGVHVVSGSLSGDGQLHYNGDGTFTYTPGAGEQGDVTFQYTITDGDGDTSTATVTIHLQPDSTPTISTSGGDTVDEAALPVGSDPSSPNETTTGTINITTGGDTVGKLVIDGVDVTHGGTVTGADGVLTVTLNNGVYSYSYTLSGPTSTDSAGDNFNITVTDSDGDTASTTLHINILDDVPTAHADVNSVSEGGTVTGNVETNDVFGADGKAAGGGVTGVEAGSHPGDVVTTGVGTAIAGTYGTLTLNADGSYSYHANPNSVSPPGATDTFTYTITDGDGDKSTTTLTINVNDVSLAADDQTKTVNEAALSTGSNPSSTAETATGQLSVAGATGYTAETVVGTHGTLTLNADGSYSYTLTSPVTESTANNGTDTVNGVETFTYTAHDADGNTVTGTITINVTDDVPTAHADVNSVSEGGTVTGNVETNDVFGADGKAAGGGVTGVEAGSHPGDVVTTGVGTAIAGTYGTLTLNADGSYSYHANPNSVSPPGATDTFTYTITDGDGDKSTTTLTINVNDVSLAADDQTKTVNEAALSTGSNPSSTAETATGQLSVAGATGYTAETVVGTHGTLTLNADGSYSYTLTSPVTESTANNGTDTVNGVETFTYTAHDADGNTVTGTITINVTDDVPTVGTIQALTADNTPSDPTSTGTLHLVAGADGLASVAINPDLTGITSGGHALIGSQSGDVYTAYADVNGNGVIDAGDTAVFTITVNPNAGTSGQYTFDLLQPLDGKIVTTPIDSSSAFGAGPAQDQILSGNSGGLPLSTISGWSTGAGFSEATWLSSGSAGGLTQQAVNGSTVGWGVNNNVFSTGEFMRFDFSQTTDYDGAGPYTPPSTALPNASTATFEIKGYTATDTIKVMVHYTDGTFAVVTEHGNAAHDATFVVTAPTGKFIDYVEMYAESGSGKVDLVSVGSQSSTVDVTIPVSMTFTDGDGDQTTGSTTIHVADGQTQTTPNAVVQSNAVTTAMISATPVSSGSGHTLGHQTGENWTSARTSILMGALAAVGLSSEPIAAKGHLGAGMQPLLHDHATVHTEALAPIALSTAAPHLSVNTAGLIATSVSSENAPQHETHGSVTPAHVVTEHAPQHMPTALPLHEAGEQGSHPAAHAIMAAAIHMPAAAQLHALVSQQHPAPDAAQANAGHQVGHVLADALAGGAGHASAVDAILHNVASHSGPVGGLSPLASHFDAGVSNGDNGHLAAFTAIQTAHIEHLIAHAHAAHPHG